MLKLLTVAAIAAAIVLIIASASINYLFASSMGKTPTEGSILGAVAIGVDVLKAVLAVLLGYAARERRWMFVLVGCAAFTLFSALSLAAAFGFSASNRHAVLGERDRGNHRLATVEGQIAELRGKLKALPQHRLLAIVDDALAIARADQRWSASRECTAATNIRAREFCDGVAVLRSERIAAQEAARLEQMITEREAEVEMLRQAGNGIAADPQARSIAQALGLSEGQVQRGLSALLAVVVEIGSALGVYIALGHGLLARRNRSPSEVTAASAQAIEEVPAVLTPIPALKPSEPQADALATSDAAVTHPATVDVGAPDAPGNVANPGIAVGVRVPPRRKKRTAKAHNGEAVDP